MLHKAIALVSCLSLGFFALHDPQAVITGRVYYGLKDEFDPLRNPAVAVVDSKKVYREIPSYKVILKEGIKKDSARYAQLMYHATLVFKSAVIRVAEGHYHFVAEKGGVSGYPTKDITKKLLEEV